MLQSNNYFQIYTLMFILINNEDLQHWYEHKNYENFCTVQKPNLKRKVHPSV